MAALPFLAILIAPLPLRLLGPRRGLLLATALLCATYLAEKTAASALADLLLGGVAVGAWGWVVVGSLVTLRLGVALGLILGAALDLAIRLAFMTVDLPWTNDPAATLVAGGLVVGALLGMRIAAPRARNTGEVDARLLGPVVGLGLWLALTLLVTANSAQVMARTEAGFGAVAGALAVGHADRKSVV